MLPRSEWQKFSAGRGEAGLHSSLRVVIGIEAPRFEKLGVGILSRIEVGSQHGSADESPLLDESPIGEPVVREHLSRERDYVIFKA